MFDPINLLPIRFQFIGEIQLTRLYSILCVKVGINKYLQWCSFKIEIYCAVLPSLVHSYAQPLQLQNEKFSQTFAVWAQDVTAGYKFPSWLVWVSNCCFSSTDRKANTSSASAMQCVMICLWESGLAFVSNWIKHFESYYALFLREFFCL